jgi:DNA-directed RNA polymerase specialized sigma24 family protein
VTRRRRRSPRGEPTPDITTTPTSTTAPDADATTNNLDVEISVVEPDVEPDEQLDDELRLILHNALCDIAIDNRAAIVLSTLTEWQLEDLWFIGLVDDGYRRMRAEQARRGAA